MAEMHLRVYIDKSELVHSDGRIEVFLEGASCAEARQRYRAIETALSNGYLNHQIDLCKSQEASGLGFSSLSDEDATLLDNLVDTITSEVGRALVALTVMQLCIKSIEPTQSIRLHKGGRNSSGFSWTEGISMRTLDSHYVTPALRAHNLLLLNSYGLFMTRSLAENYPYSRMYKAQMRGGRHQWLEVVERIEDGSLPPEVSLRYLLSQLINRAEQFRVLAESMLRDLDDFSANSDVPAITRVILEHIHQSDYAARLMEIAMHSLLQAVWEFGTLAGGEIVPLSQMRSANKKHGNIGDVEIKRDGQIVEAWDAKYGKGYLRDEIEELTDKLAKHPDVELVGFVTSDPPERLSELMSRMGDIEAMYGVVVRILPFVDWVQEQFIRLRDEGVGSPEALARRWFLAYGESLAQKRRLFAPIDEPCQRWVETLQAAIAAARSNPT